MGKFTEGPWVASQYLDNGQWGVVTNHPRMEVFDTGEIVVGVASRITEANARLIAAAPELLEACQVALESLRAWNVMGLPKENRDVAAKGYEHSPEIKALVAAIAKAEGEL